MLRHTLRIEPAAIVPGFTPLTFMVDDTKVLLSGIFKAVLLEKLTGLEIPPVALVDPLSVTQPPGHTEVLIPAFTVGGSVTVTLRVVKF